MKAARAFRITRRTARRTVRAAAHPQDNPQQFRPPLWVPAQAVFTLLRQTPARTTIKRAYNGMPQPTTYTYQCFFTAQERLHIFQKKVIYNKQTGMPAAKARHTVLLR